MSLASKIKTAFWYISRPKYYREFIALAKQKVVNSEKENSAAESADWCKSVAIDTPSAIFKITGKQPSVTIEEEYKDVFEEATRRQNEAPVKMGGAGNLDLLYHLCEHVQAKEVIETGVAYGWSTLATLLSLHKRNGSLNSVDMPYAKMGNDDYVGVVVPEFLRKNWNLIRFPDRKGLDIALNNTKTLDLCHYDSDKSYAGRMFAYPKLWAALRPGGIFISDDIQDNMGFHDYCKNNNFTPIVVGHHGKYIGVITKPS